MKLKDYTHVGWGCRDSDDEDAFTDNSSGEVNSDFTDNQLTD
jgi:hypothetical protein